MSSGVVTRGLRFGLAVGLLCMLGWGALWLVGPEKTLLGAEVVAEQGHVDSW